VKKILVSWIGATDLRALSNKNNVGIGPIAQAVNSSDYEIIVLISDYSEGETVEYHQWLQDKTLSKITIEYVNLSSPTDYGEIYQFANQLIESLQKKYGVETSLTFHLSPGTPAMAAIWILLSKTKYHSELIESSKQHGVKTVEIPFDISAEFIPGIFQKSDNQVKLLAAGLHTESPEFKDIIHRSDVMRRLIVKAQKVSPRNIPVLIEGESGTGKELLARAIHEASPRKGKSFVALNCGAIPHDLVEAELFGYEKGAFTGASQEKIGLFEAANNGTLLLDEIGELGLDSQVKLLRAIQEGESKRIGAVKPVKVDVRIIASTNRNLISEMASGAFREDLFYRLAVAVLKVPPLRERSGDIGLLIYTLIERINEESINEPGYYHKKVSVSARNILLKYHWPGNVRELMNTLTRAAVWSEGDIDEKDIQEAILEVPSGLHDHERVLNLPINDGVDLPELIKLVAVHYLTRGLKETHGNKTKTAELLGVSNYQTLTNWLRKYGIE
jgi:transcriptional regulator with PAS, ATPase and Fis domain